jgi:Na+-driven multidrug efflux pump
MGDRPGWHTVLVVAMVTVNFVADLVLIPMWGIAGAAAATSIAVLVAALLLRWLAKTRVAVRL